MCAQSQWPPAVSAPHRFRRLAGGSGTSTAATAMAERRCLRMTAGLTAGLATGCGDGDGTQSESAQCTQWAQRISSRAVFKKRPRRQQIGAVFLGSQDRTAEQSLCSIHTPWRQMPAPATQAYQACSTPNQAGGAVQTGTDRRQNCRLFGVPTACLDPLPGRCRSRGPNRRAAAAPRSQPQLPPRRRGATAAAGRDLPLRAAAFVGWTPLQAARSSPAAAMRRTAHLNHRLLALLPPLAALREHRLRLIQHGHDPRHRILWGDRRSCGHCCQPPAGRCGFDGCCLGFVRRLALGRLSLFRRCTPARHHCRGCCWRLDCRAASRHCLQRFCRQWRCWRCMSGCFWELLGRLLLRACDLAAASRPLLWSHRLLWHNCCWPFWRSLLGSCCRWLPAEHEKLRGLCQPRSCRRALLAGCRQLCWRSCLLSGRSLRPWHPLPPSCWLPRHVAGRQRRSSGLCSLGAAISGSQTAA